MVLARHFLPHVTQLFSCQLSNEARLVAADGSVDDSD